MRRHPEMVFVRLLDHRAVDLGGHGGFGSSQAVNPDLDYVRMSLGHRVHRGAGFFHCCRAGDLIRGGGQGRSGVGNAYTAVCGKDRSTIQLALPLLLANPVEQIAVYPQR